MKEGGTRGERIVEFGLLCFTWCSASPSLEMALLV